jgi:hypothetical protein
MLLHDEDRDARTATASTARDSSLCKQPGRRTNGPGSARLLRARDDAAAHKLVARVRVRDARRQLLDLRPDRRGGQRGHADRKVRDVERVDLLKDLWPRARDVREEELLVAAGRDNHLGRNLWIVCSGRLGRLDMAQILVWCAGLGTTP